ncbi:MAG TPA: exonuclease SbcCD subunit D [Telluria sp.]|jgi:exonuclease SbcD
MRLLHTSDWHLGQTLHHHDRTYEHQCFLDWLLDTIVLERPDALLVAGDVFDSANPPAASQEQLYRFLQQARVRAPLLDIVIIAGNHDSPGRLEAPAPLLGAYGTTVIGRVARRPDGEIDLERLIVPLHDARGAVAAWCIAIPFLRSGDLPRLPAPEPLVPPESYQNGVALLYRQAFALAQARCVNGQVVVAMGHCHMAGGQASLDSERRIVIGGVEALPVPRKVGLLRVPPQPAPLGVALAALDALDLEELPLAAQPFLEVRVLLDAPEPGLRARVEAAIAGKPVRLAKIEPTRPHNGTGEAGAALSLEQLAQIGPDDIFRSLYRQTFGDEAPSDQLSAFAELMLPGPHGDGP